MFHRYDVRSFNFASTAAIDELQARHGAGFSLADWMTRVKAASRNGLSSIWILRVRGYSFTLEDSGPRI